MVDNDTEVRLLALLTAQESFSAKPYADSEGNLTLGIGWNVYAMPMTKNQAEYICKDHIAYFDGQLNTLFPFYASLSGVRKSVLINMAFQMGVPNFLTFKKFIGLVSLGTYFAASTEMLNSQWARAFTRRSATLSKMMASNLWPPAVVT